MASPTRFDSYSVAECSRELPLKGCFLSPDEDSEPYVVKDGIPYHLQAIFNKKDQLTSVKLVYQVEGDVSSEECQDIGLRSLDWLGKEFGPMVGDRAKAQKENLRTIKSPGGNELHATKADSGGWLGESIATFPGDRRLWVITHFAILDESRLCDFEANFLDRKMLQWEYR